MFRRFDSEGGGSRDEPQQCGGNGSHGGGSHAVRATHRPRGDRFDLALGNDADADRHGVVTPTAGLLNPNHVLSALIAYLFAAFVSLLGITVALWGSGIGPLIGA